MKILVTGSNGFVGQNLVWNLKEIRDGKNRSRPDLVINEIYEFDINSPLSDLEYACSRADFVFNFAGVNRPKEQTAFMEGNYGFAGMLLDMLKSCGNQCPVMLASSIQASMVGRFRNSEYGKSKFKGEGLFWKYGEETGAKILIYRFPNLFGKWSKPNYNSAVATFCHAFANDFEYQVSDPETELELVYIDDLVEEMLDALDGNEHRCDYPLDDSHTGIEAVENPNGQYCYVPLTYHITLGRIIECLKSFKSMPETLFVPEIPDRTFVKKLYSTYLSYLPENKIAYTLKSNVDNRGNFTELIRTPNCGQVSINVVKPGMVRGEHWHNSKWEIFIVVSGHGLIQERRIGINPDTGKEYPIIEFEVTGEQMRAVQMLPGYTHNIKNLSRTNDLVTVMWANETFDPAHPDTYFEPVAENRSNRANSVKGNV